MDPAEVRRRNLVPRFTDRYTTGIGTVYDVGDYPEALERVLAAAGYDDLRAEQAAPPRGERPDRAGHRHRGVRRDHRRAPGSRVRRGRAARRTAAARAQRRDAVRAGPRHDVGDGGVRPHRRADRAHRGRPRRHRPGARPGGLTVGSRSVQIGGAAIDTRHGDAGRRSRASGPPTCSRRGRRRRARRRARPCSTSRARRPRTVDWGAIAACRRRDALRPRATSRP